ncbi:MAG: membrane protein insertion efficiency factor YidD [Syntrophobacterales bacterium]
MSLAWMFTFCLWLGELNETSGFACFLADAAYAGVSVCESTASFGGFSEVISPVDGDRCPSYPTCAAYSKEAYQKHGAFVGTLMTVDRLFHEADEYRFSPTVKVYGVYRIYDPVSANEYWKRNDNSKAEAKPTE